MGHEAPCQGSILPRKSIRVSKPPIRFERRAAHGEVAPGQDSAHLEQGAALIAWASGASVQSVRPDERARLRSSPSRSTCTDPSRRRSVRRFRRTLWLDVLDPEGAARDSRRRCSPGCLRSRGAGFGLLPRASPAPFRGSVIYVAPFGVLRGRYSQVASVLALSTTMISSGGRVCARSEYRARRQGSCSSL